MKKYKKGQFELDIIYPNKMYGGVYALGPLVVYNLVNNTENWNCKRVFLDAGKITAPLVGFSVQYEPDLKNILKMKPEGVLTFAGGPVVNNNLPLVEKYFDFFFLGDIEESLPQVLKEWEKGKETFLERIAKIKGIYVPKINKPTYAQNKDLDKIPYPIVQPFPQNLGKEYVFGKCFMLEIERGCPFRCNFCSIPSFYPKTKYRSLENLKHIIDEGIRINRPDKIVIYSPSFVHPKRKELLRYLIDKKIRVVIPSIRAEHIDLELLQLIKEIGQESLTIAPETAQELRFKINKRVKDEQYFKFIELCNQVGIKKVKMYMMIGLPETTQKDLEAFVAFTKEMKKKFKGRLYLSINYFTPKPKTPFEDHVFDKKELKEQAKYITTNLKTFKIKMPKINTSYREWIIAKEGIQ
jgi:radical SAM superfamily enzyme YgiQ (UPF0313 family)